jgi:hypothetical protein
MKLTSILSAYCALALFAGCSTIVSGTHEDVRIRSNPSGAIVKVDGVSRGITPAEVELSRRKNHTVSIELAGYRPYELELKKAFNPWIFGNIFFGGLVGVIVDLSTGAVYKLSPYEIDAELQPASARGTRRMTVTSKDGLLIATTLQPKSHWERIGQLERM